MSLGQYLEYIARFVLIMPCVMRKRSKGSIGLTNSSPWRQNRNVVCHLGSPFCQTPQLMLGPEHLVRNVLIEKHTLTPKVGQREVYIQSSVSHWSVIIAK